MARMDQGASGGARNRMIARPIAERFWEKVPVRSPWPEDCWEWTASIDRGGYGRFFDSDMPTNRAHKVAWILTGGEMPDGWEMDHACRNRRCVRPEHLSIVPPGSSAQQGGERLAAKLRARTHCRNGHEMTVENKYVTRLGYWQCRKCHKNTEQRRRDSLKR